MENFLIFFVGFFRDKQTQRQIFLFQPNGLIPLIMSLIDDQFETS